MVFRPICEPIELPLGVSVLAEHVTVAADAPAIGRFMHFHDVAELVLFRRVRGDFIAGGRRHRLTNGAITFVPSMHHHDFALEPGPMEWMLIQIDPYLVESMKPALARLSRPFCVFPGPAARARYDMLADWLGEAARNMASSAERIVELLLLAAALEPERSAAGEEDSAAHVERLLPVLERIRSHPDETIALESAAAMCNLSPSYFSRRFKQTLGVNFTDYVRIYRLHLAARRLATTGTAISKIAYDVGFSSPSHFSARFHERFAMSPREYRNSARRRAHSVGVG